MTQPVRNLNPLFDRLWEEYNNRRILIRPHRDYRGLRDLKIIIDEEEKKKNEYNSKLYQDAIALVGDLPANDAPSYEHYFELTNEEQTGRKVAFYLLGKVAESMNVYTGVDRIIRDAAVGLVVNAGVCDTYASLVAVLAVIMPGPVEPKQIRVRSEMGHTYPIVYGYKVDVHSKLYYCPQKNNTILSGDVNLTKVTPHYVMFKLQEYRKVMQKHLNENLKVYLQEYVINKITVQEFCGAAAHTQRSGAAAHTVEELVEELVEEYKDAYRAFIGMSRLVRREAIAEKQRIISQIRQKFSDYLMTQGIRRGIIINYLRRGVDGIRNLPIDELRNLYNNWEKSHREYNLVYP